MRHAIILHGTEGSPSGNWYSWLETELIAQGMEVWLPKLPNANKPSLREWSDYVQQNTPFVIDEQTLIVGHSSGAILALILAQESLKSIGAIVCVSVFSDNSLRWDALNRLFDVPFNFDAIKNNAGQMLFIHSDNDPYVPLTKAEYVANNCDQELVIIPGQGHFNLEQSSTYTSFSKLTELLEEHHLI